MERPQIGLLPYLTVNGPGKGKVMSLKWRTITDLLNLALGILAIGVFLGAVTAVAAHPFLHDMDPGEAEAGGEDEDGVAVEQMECSNEHFEFEGT
jgi:hypothetical protein